MENILAGVVVEKDDNLVTVSMEAGGGTVQAISDSGVGERVYALVRPEDITIVLTRERTSARNFFEGHITRTVPVGPLVRIEVDCGFPLLGLVTKRSAEELDLAIGKGVYAGFKATAVRTVKRSG